MSLIICVCQFPFRVDDGVVHVRYLRANVSVPNEEVELMAAQDLFDMEFKMV